MSSGGGGAPLPKKVPWISASENPGVAKNGVFVVSHFSEAHGFFC